MEVTALERDPAAATLLLHCRLTPRPVACPDCGQPTTRVHQYHRRRIRDLPWAGHRTWLVLTRRRLHCRMCGRIFSEPSAAVAPRATTTRRYAAVLVAACRDTSLAAVARREEVGYKLVEGLYYATAAAQYPVGPPTRPIRVLGLDEIAVRKGRGDFKLVVVNIETGAVLDQLATRDKATVAVYFAACGSAPDLMKSPLTS